ncbi:MAG: hypothetical protein ACOYKZ_03340 [Chlamydiia bacterium]
MDELLSDAVSSKAPCNCWEPGRRLKALDDAAGALILICNIFLVMFRFYCTTAVDMERRNNEFNAPYIFAGGQQVAY